VLLFVNNMGRVDHRQNYVNKFAHVSKNRESPSIHSMKVFASSWIDYQLVLLKMN